MTGNGQLLGGLEAIAEANGILPTLLLARWAQEMGWPCVLSEATAPPAASLMSNLERCKRIQTLLSLKTFAHFLAASDDIEAV